MFNLFRRASVVVEAPKEKRGPLPPMRRNFTMADSGRLFEDWSGSPDDFSAMFAGQIAIVRKRARDLAENDPTCLRFLRLMETNVIGPNGIQLVPRPHRPDGKIDTADAAILRKGWNEWGRFGEPTMCRQYDWRGAKARALRDFLVCGEAIIRHVNTSRNKFGYAIAFIDPVQLDHTYNVEPVAGANRIKMGVELDVWGAPVAYHFVDSNVLGGGQRQRIPADQITHLFIKEREGQTRGVTWLAPVGARKRLLDGYEIASVVAARVAASKMGFFTFNPEFPEPEAEGEEGATGALLQDVAPGQLERLPPGMGFEAFDPSWPGADYDSFQKSIKRSIAAGLNVSYNTLGMDLEGVSWSGLRKGELDDRDFYRVMQRLISSRIQQPVWERLLYWGLEFGGFGNLPRTKYEKFLEVAHRPRGWQWVNPQQQQESYRKALLNRTTTVTRIIQEDLGISLEEFAEELELEMQTLGKLHPLYSLKDTELNTPDFTNEDPPKN